MDKTGLLGEWVHAHERDVGGAKVFVDADEPLPPSRGRQRLRFLSDGTFEEGMPGADDRSVQASGTYRLNGTRLVLQRDGQTQPVEYEAARVGGKSLHLTKV